MPVLANFGGVLVGVESNGVVDDVWGLVDGAAELDDPVGVTGGFPGEGVVGVAVGGLGVGVASCSS